MPPKRKKRFHGLYYHSSPPRVLPMNAQAPVETKKKSADDFSIRLSTIRIWMHEKDIGKLTRVLWAGQGNRLRQQASTNPKVKRFLAAVPYVMNSIKDVHQSVVDNSLETLQATMESNVPPTLITCKDANGLNVIHKAAGLGHYMMLEYLLSIWPDGAHETDMTGKTALHWAASAKNNMRCYTLLTQAGCEEDALDYKMKTPLYYKQKHNEIERSFLTQVPEAPRVSQDIPVDWEALASDDSDDRKKPDIIIPNGRRKSDILGNSVNLLTSRSEANSIENTSEPDLFQGDNTNDEHHEPQIEEPKSNDDTKNPLENGHMTNSEVEISESEPASPPETPEETQEEEETQNEEEELEEKEPEKLSEDENVGNTLNDQNNNEEESGVDKAEEDKSSDNVENIKNGDEKEAIEDEGHKEKENEDKKDEENQEKGDTENKEANVEDDKKEEVKEEIETKEKNDEENEDTEKEVENDKEKTDVTDSIKDNDETDKDNDKTKEQITNEEEEEIKKESDEKPSAEEITESSKEQVDENPSAEEVTESSEKEVENESSSPSTEKTEVEDIKTKETQIETTDSKDQPLEETPSSPSEVSQPETQSEEKQSKEPSTEETLLEQSSSEEIHVETPEEKRPQSKKSETGSSNSADSHSQKLENETDEIKINGNHSFKDGKTSKDEKHKEDKKHEDDDEDDDDDQERYIEAIINSGDMEQLAALVLNGDGKKILNRKSSKPEIQAFLTNVPAYMDKISRVHEAARQGTLYQLQAALDRRKFAIAKDEMSPCGASPLHVGVLFGHSDIVRYLAGRFPETTSAVDDDGRTALHYAATINDNGHFFNLLSHLGGNPKATDKLGNTAEFYMNDERAKNVLTYRQLLKRFGAETLEDEMLSDQVPDDLHSSRRNMLDMDVATTLERCFSVIQESSKCLSSATASAIATQRRPRSASSQPLTVTSYLGKFLRRSVFDKIKKRQTRLDHNLFDVIWPAMRKTIRERRFDEDLNLGVIAPDYDVYVVFQEFLVPLIKDIHCLNISSDFKPHPRIAYFPIANGERMTHLPFVLNDESKLITQCSIECSRNLEGLELPLNLNVAQIEQAERAMMGKIFTTNFAKAIGDKETGSYYTLNEVIEENSVILKMLQDAGLLIPDLEVKDRAQEAECLAYNGQLWPYGRGVFVNAEQNLALWLNCQEHLRIISSTGRLNAPNIGMIYSKVGRAVTYLETQLHFKESYLLGYLAARPHFLGTGLKMTTTIQLPNLIKEVDNLRHLCSVRGLLMMSSQLKNSVRLVNMQSLGAIELLLFKEYCTAVTNIISLEKDMSLTNSKHIASMLVKIFRRKKDTLVDRT
ncbi:uncharacterized protein LOC129906680 isoform X2 [Episyrphus balteatus]|uniref:uncharacterized protein LOC129906680 isoform X2 n=1 Tax=Episyrphus balteatus TaxID=286459 RepID=UPI002486C5C9|nr:uncharacterized protein LOC129906680 isoform X2 [Episyrphus balteatus]